MASLGVDLFCHGVKGLRGLFLAPPFFAGAFTNQVCAEVHQYLTTGSGSHVEGETVTHSGIRTSERRNGTASGVYVMGLHESIFF
jgi:hypothetical protein